MEQNFKAQLQKVRAFVFDVDGVMTDGSLVVMPGELFRIMNIRDGYAMNAAIKAGYKIIVISGGKSESVKARLNALGVEDVFLGIQDKTEVLFSEQKRHGLNKEEILYMGDDLPDYEVIQHAGIRTCPSDAAPEIKNLCSYVSSKAGGHGCVRDVIEQVMRLQGNWPYQNETRKN